MNTEIDRQSDVRKAVEQAEELRLQGKHDESIKLLSDTLRYGVDQGHIYYRLGNVYFDAKRYDHAEYSYRRAIDHDSLHVNAHYNLGVVFKKMGRVDESMKMRKKANKLAQQHPEKLSVSTDQIERVRSFAKKLFFWGMAIILLLVVLYILLASL